MIEKFLEQRRETEKKLIDFFKANADIQQQIQKDLEFLYNNDPSAKSLAEVSCYTSAFAVAAYRVAHACSDDQVARRISEYAKSLTGVDIHPKAKIGIPFAIDHGVGVVIGETAEIGNNSMLYHGVTLGARHLKDRDQVGKDRHPKLGDNVIVYSNTTILGNIHLHDGMIIGANKFIKKQEEIDEMLKARD